MDFVQALLFSDFLGTPSYFWLIFISVVVGLLVLDLGQVDQALVVAEIHVTKFWMPINAQAFHDQGLEMFGQIIGEIECAGLGIMQCQEFFFAGEELIAVCAANAFHAFFLKNSIQHAAGSTIAIGNKDVLECSTRFVDLLADTVWNLVRCVVPSRRKALDFDGIPSIRTDHCHDFPGKRTARNDKAAVTHLRISRPQPNWPCDAR